ncbi:MAG: porin [Alphaproteobacteria bacterium]|nr:porin [Alphaproteobacteria bacterium]MBU0798863.1 porin [Alphaproteobacteria bacterium]MBU0888713.1 porin [Alphaproteobacteria bacterium]MBU1813553.1 porin [Alphaproteobacteria bacterium]MBU2090499.1 porin [Alphaproteobacteria bacterium]
MKHALLGTTGLVAAGMAVSGAVQPAMAIDPISLSVNGYYENVVSYTSQDGASDFKKVHFRHEGELDFNGETKLDNGLTVGFSAALEIVNTGDTNGPMDEVYMYLEGGFGKVQLGSKETAAFLMHYQAPYVGIGVNTPNFAPYENNGAPTSTYLVQSDDANKITYFTPEFSGFQFGVSYVPDVSNTSGNTQGFGVLPKNVMGEQQDWFSLGASYTREIGAVELGMSAGYEFATLGANDAAGTFDDYKAYSFGLNVGFAGFTVGGSYAKFNNGLSGSNDGKAWDVGIIYETGPYGFGVTYFNGEDEGTSAESKLVDIAASYTPIEGVKFATGVILGDFSPAPATGADDKAFAVYFGTFLSF